jgi:hypothetical protein
VSDGQELSWQPLSTCRRKMVLRWSTRGISQQ